jgi:seryl-tRNA(Sec) selenium transferase
VKLIAILLLSGLAACTKAASSASPDALGDTAAARAAVAKLEAEVIATARTDGCASAAGCRTAPIGDKACGGPRSYIAYCAASTDSAALFTKVNELKEADRKLNKLTHAVSTCEFRMPPTPTLAGGRCTAP